jgi:predicted nucleotidyltransferase
MKFKESTLKQYAAPLSETEDTKCKRAIEAIRDALSDLGYTDDQKGISLLENDTLSYSVAMRNKYSSERVHIFIQGSYANNTCVRNESDVDIAVVREDIYEYAWRANLELTTEDRRKEAKALKDAVERVLRNRFPAQVHRGNKSIKVDGNTYRKQADTVPCISLHHYYRSHLNDYLTHRDGVVIFADDGSVIRNFPKQHIANGKAKNANTNHYYKKMVRIMKKMRHIMSDYGYESADEVSSFGLESLLWNVPDSQFTKYHCYGFVFEELIRYLHDNQFILIHGLEANGIKELCPTQKEVSAYTDFIDDLYKFFEYDYTS